MIRFMVDLRDEDLALLIYSLDACALSTDNEEKKKKLKSLKKYLRGAVISLYMKQPFINQRFHRTDKQW